MLTCNATRLDSGPLFLLLRRLQIFLTTVMLVHLSFLSLCFFSSLFFFALQSALGGSAAGRSYRNPVSGKNLLLLLLRLLPLLLLIIRRIPSGFSCGKEGRVEDYTRLTRRFVQGQFRTTSKFDRSSTDATTCRIEGLAPKLWPTFVLCLLCVSKQTLILGELKTL